MQFMKTLRTALATMETRLTSFFGPGNPQDSTAPHPVAEAISEVGKSAHDMLANHEQRIAKLEGKFPSEHPLLADGNQGHSLATLQGDNIPADAAPIPGVDRGAAEPGV